LSRDKYFDQKEYLLGDLAFYSSSAMVTAFKKGHNANFSEEWRYFNTKLAKIQIKRENYIGLTKAWFQHLWGFQRVIWHSGLLHVSKASSFLRHFEWSLQLLSICGLWEKKIIVEIELKPIIFEVTIIIALFWVLTNLIFLDKIT